MGQRLANAGFVKRKTIIDSWKESTWEFKIDAAEVNVELLRSKELCEQKLSVEKQKRIRLEGDLQASQNSLSKETSERQHVLSELTSTKCEVKRVEKVNEQLTNPTSDSQVR